MTKAMERKGLRADLLAFFRACPDEFLTISDAVVKFGTTRQNVLDTACRMRQRGELAEGPELRTTT
jgi:hypothetical protein